MNNPPRIKHCATCAKEMDIDKKEFITVMHAQMHRYVCSEKCMHDFYKFGKK